MAFTNPGLVDLYAHHPRRERIQAAREEAGILPVDEVWMITTRGAPTDTAIQGVRAWHALLDDKLRPLLRVWQVADTGDLASEAECRSMAECIFRLVLYASEQAKDGQLLISLTGGRKTMSSDIQNAARFFGCHAMLHVIQNDAFRDKVRGLTQEDFVRPLPRALGDAITPLVAGRRYAQDASVDFGAGGRILAADFPVPMPQGDGPIALRVPDLRLTEQVHALMRDASFVYCNHANRVMGNEKASNFLALYSLPPSLIQRLKALRIGVDPRLRDPEMAWLRKLPKVDLHCHLGGVAGPEELIAIAEAVEHKLGPYKDALSPFLERWRQRLDTGEILGEDFKALRTAVPGVPEPLCTAAFVLLFRDRPDLLDERIYGPLREEGAFCRVAFGAYERLGDLQGSGLLQAKECLAQACRILVRKAREDKVTYLELRCSPVNYTRGGLSPSQVAHCIEGELKAHAEVDHCLIFSASRHGRMSRVYEHIELAQSLLGRDGSGFPHLRGFDLAGNEAAASPSDMRQAFMPMMERCMHFTIHAGETDDVTRVWEAVYHLSAERIGHGLTLKDNPVLMERFRERGIALEMCPSSNFQIVGFRDNHLPQTAHLPAYPLKTYLDQGLRVTVNTDNPGISRTGMTEELHRAGRLTPGGLSCWEVLLLLRNGFKAAFAQSETRQRVLLEAEAQIIGQLREGGIPTDGWS